jgi:hypothetical protein
MEKIAYVLVSVRVPDGRDPDDFLDELEFKAVNTHDGDDYLLGVDAYLDGVPEIVTK